MTNPAAKCDTIGTGDLAIPGCVRRLSAREAAALAGLAGLGLAGNYFSVPLFFGVDFLFGSIAALIAVRLCGGLWGLPVAAVAASYTVALWGHPYAIIIFTAEALVVGMVCCRFKTENLILVDACFWVFLGMPMVWVFYTYFLGMDPTAVKLIMFKQGINGIVNAVAANVLLHLLPVMRWIGGRSSETRISLQQLLFNVLSAFIIVPMLTSTVIANREELEDIKSAIVENLNDDLAELDNDLGSWHARHAAMLRFGVLEAVQSDAVASSDRLERLAKSIPGLLGIQYTTEDGKIIAAYPGHDDRGLPYVGQISVYSSYFAQASSGVFTVSDIHRDPLLQDAHFASVVPFAAKNKKSGFIVATFTPEHIAEFLAREANEDARQITILDAERRVISSINTGDRPMDNFTLDRQGKFVRLDGSQYHWLPATNGSKLPEMVRWKRSSFVAEAPLRSSRTWSVVVGMPMASYVDRLREDYTRKLLLVVVISVLGLVLVPIVSRRLSAPLERLTSITDRIVETGDLAAGSDWPNSGVREISRLSASFRAMVNTTLSAAAENRRIADDLTQLIETSNAPIFSVDAEGLITVWNQAAAEITGLDNEDVLGGHILEQFVEEDRPDLKEIMRGIYGGHGVVSHEIDVRTIAGRRVQVLLNATLCYDAAGNVVGAVGIGQDITERKKAEEALRESEDGLANAQRIARLGNWDWNIVTNELRWSDEIYRIFGLQPQEFDATYEAFLDSVHPGDRALVQKAVDRALEDGEAYSIDHRIVLPSGEQRQVHAQAEVTFSDRGEPLRMAGTVQDITERRRVEAELIQAAKMATLGEMATGMAHELNQPLNVVSLVAESLMDLIEDGEVDADFLHGKLERIRAQTVRAAEIIDHMRVFGRTDDGTPKPVDPIEAVTGALNLMKEQLRLREIDVETRFPMQPRKIMGHAVRLEQVVLNLIGNARDAIESKGRCGREPRKISLIVEDASPPNQIKLIVRDTGGGIPEDVLTRIFEPFFTTKEVGKGTGLGLSISYGIVTNMGGTIKAANVGDGAEITITLPVLDEQARAA